MNDKSNTWNEMSKCAMEAGGGDIRRGEKCLYGKRPLIKSQGGLDKKAIEEAAKAAMEDSFARFDEDSDDPRSCCIGVYEDIEDSGWRGEWTERIRSIVREKSPDVECVCVKPLPNGKVVWYSVDVM